MLLDVWTKDDPACEWCGEEIEREGGYVTLVEVEEGGGSKPSGTEKALFHTGTCVGEATDHGWG